MVWTVAGKNIDNAQRLKLVLKTVIKMNNHTLRKLKNKPILYYNDISPPVRFVLMTIKALNIDVDYRMINLFSGEQYSIDYIKINPLNTVPTLVDDHVTITDSHAICTYLVDMYNEDSVLYPRDPKKRSQIDRILYFNSSMLFPRESKILQSPFNPKHRDVPFSKIVDDYFESLSYLEQFCSFSKWLAGNEMTLADICCISTYSTGELLITVDKEEFPNIQKWSKLCKSESFYKLANEPGLSNLKSTIVKYGDFTHVDEKYKDMVDKNIKLFTN